MLFVAVLNNFGACEGPEIHLTPQEDYSLRLAVTLEKLKRYRELRFVFSFRVIVNVLCLTTSSKILFPLGSLDLLAFCDFWSDTS